MNNADAYKRYLESLSINELRSLVYEAGMDYLDSDNRETLIKKIQADQ